MASEFNYGRYLASREWALLKEQVRRRSKDHCERCGGPYEETHHVTYERIGHERLADLLAVCTPCHQFLSGLADLDPSVQSRKDAQEKAAGDAWYAAWIAPRLDALNLRRQEIAASFNDGTISRDEFARLLDELLAELREIHGSRDTAR